MRYINILFAYLLACCGRVTGQMSLLTRKPVTSGLFTPRLLSVADWTDRQTDRQTDRGRCQQWVSVGRVIRSHIVMVVDLSRKEAAVQHETNCIPRRLLCRRVMPTLLLWNAVTASARLQLTPLSCCRLLRTQVIMPVLVFRSEISWSPDIISKQRKRDLVIQR